MVELHVLLEPRGIVGGVILKPDPVEVETRIAPPSESLKGPAALGVLDVVADIDAAIDSCAQPLVEMAAVIDSATRPRDDERVPAGAAGWNIGTQRHD